MALYRRAHGSTRVISWTDVTLGDSHPLLRDHHVSCCQISCPRCDDDHSARRGGPTQYWGASVRGLTTCWIGKSSKWLPPYNANIGCDCLPKIDLGTGSGGNPKDPGIRRARQPFGRFLSGTSRPICWYTHFRWQPGRLPSLLGSSRPPIKPSSTEPPSSSNHAAKPGPPCSQRRINCSPAMAERRQPAVMQFP